jgi:pilus assembly protein CpaE
MSTSETIHTVTSLLPQARIHVFSTDKRTCKSAQAAKDDWRFARTEIEVIEGGIDEAVAFYESKNAVGDVLVVQTKAIDDDLTENLEALSAYCEEDTVAIVIGPKNDVDLYRALIDMGVSDYLVAPVKSEEFIEILARGVLEKLGAADSTLIAFVGSKGGVGASTLAEAAAWAASDMLGQKTLLIDGSGGWASHGIGMGFEPATTLAQAARAAASDDEENLNRMIISVGDKLDVLGSGGDVMLEDPITGEEMEMLTTKLMTKYPAVIADLSGATPGVKKTILMQAGKIAVVATPMLASLRQARTLIQEITSIRDEALKEVSLIINMLKLDKTNEVSLKEIKEALEIEPEAVIDFVANLFIKGESESRKLTSTEEGRTLLDKTLLPFLREVLGAQVTGKKKKENRGLVDKIKAKLKG